MANRAFTVLVISVIPPPFLICSEDDVAHPITERGETQEVEVLDGPGEQVGVEPDFHRPAISEARRLSSKNAVQVVIASVYGDGVVTVGFPGAGSEA